MILPRDSIGNEQNGIKREKNGIENPQRILCNKKKKKIVSILRYLIMN